MADQFLPVIVALVVAGVFTAVLLGSAVLFGQRTRQPTAAKTESYESGVPLLDRANRRISVKFYLVALVFVVLDVELAFLYPWAINFRSLLDGGSMVALWDMLAFLAHVALTYVYLWRKGNFDWGRRRLPTPGSGDRE